MKIAHNFIDEIDRLLQRAMKDPGLVPQWSSATASASVPADVLPRIAPLIADPAALVKVPADTWGPELLECWRLGLVFLRDARAQIADGVSITARRLIIRESQIGPFSSIAGDRVLITHTYAGSQLAVDGPAALLSSRLRQQIVIGPFVIVTRTGIEPLTKISRFARVDKSLIGSNCAIEGSTHAELIPLGAQRRTLGVGIGPDCWIGQHASITAGGVVGEGVVVGAHTSIHRRIGEFVFVAGTPAREFPIDFNIRGLSADEAVNEGKAQGLLAISMPVFGPPRGAFRDPRTLEIDYPRHGFLRGLASENLLHFQRGVLLTALAQFLPDHAVEVRFRAGKTVRFLVELDRPVPAPLAFRRGANAGMFNPEPEPDFLKQTWSLLVNGDGPLPPFEPGEKSVEKSVERVAETAGADEGRGDTRAILTAILRELVAGDRPIDADTPFHALGIDSLTSALLATEVEVRFGIPAPDVFSHNTLRKLADAIDQAPRI